MVAAAIAVDDVVRRSSICLVLPCFFLFLASALVPMRVRDSCWIRLRAKCAFSIQNRSKKEQIGSQIFLFNSGEQDIYLFPPLQREFLKREKKQNSQKKGVSNFFFLSFFPFLSWPRE